MAKVQGHSMASRVITAKEIPKTITETLLL